MIPVVQDALRKKLYRSGLDLRWCLASILTASSLIDALVGLLVDVFVDRASCAAMGDPRSLQSTHDVTTAAKEDVVETRAPLVDVPGVAPGDVKKWMDNFFMNEAYGAFCMNVLADVFVRLFLLICTYLALLRCWRAKERETLVTDLQHQRDLDDRWEKEKRYFRSDSFIRRVKQAVESSSAVPPSVPGSQVQANLTHMASGPSCKQSPKLGVLEGGNVGISLNGGTVLASSSSALPTELCKQVVEAEHKGPHELQLRKRRLNGTYDRTHIADGTRSVELASTPSCDSSESSTSRSRTAPRQDPKEAETGDDVVIDILPVQGVFPTSASIKTGNKLKRSMKEKMEVSFDQLQDVSSSRIIQARMRATDQNLSALRDLAVEGMQLDRGFTLQIGASFLYFCNGNPDEPVLLSLRDVEVPTVVQAQYSAGVLTIRGMFLEGAEIRAATFDGYMILKSIKQEQINNITPPQRRIEVWRCTDLLPPVNLDQIQICANKTVVIEGHDVTVRSEVLSIQNTSLRTVIRNWVPTAILIGFLASQAWILLALLLDLVTDPLHRTWLSYPVLALAIYIIQLLPASLEDKIKDFVERLKLAISSFHVLPDLLSSPAFFMRSGYCFQRGAKHLVDRKLLVGVSNRKGSPNRKGSHDGQGSGDDLEISPEELPLSSKIDEILPSNRDWKWPCMREEYDKKTKKLIIRRFDPDSKQDSSHESLSHPFTVTYSEAYSSKKKIYDLPLEYIPHNIAVKLYSKHLQEVIKKLLPTRLKLFENYGEILAKDLLILYISKVIRDTESNDEYGGECLDMFHLIRFLRKEYEKTIKQYERMMEADVISWDMLWTLIVPKADVIYYCDISKEELCGKVVSTDYKISTESDGGNEFRVKLEVCDYNCINFEVRRITSIVLPFKEEVKISDIDVYPLQYKANSQKTEEFFLMRGRKFYDLVLKYERRFMQYQGLIYNPTSRSRSVGSMRSSRSKVIETSTSSSWSYSYKESVDGRVMLDQGGFAKMKPNLSMDTAQPSRGWLEGIGLKMKVVITESDPLLKYAPAIAYGYSFSVRKWGCFSIQGISEIQFISTAFDTLVMNEDIKKFLLTLTKHHIISHPQGSKDDAINVDPLPNKGKGCIILLHGPPGTGKTLTVESLAEKLECPLWQLTVPKIFRHAEELETDLLRTFEIAASWRAILVLDEADIYLSTRKYSPLSSDVTGNNAMTGVFLRVLEYYTGILFLTTNVIDSIESAIYSRMSLFIRYEEFSIEERKVLWINFLNRIGFQHPSQEFWDTVLLERFNGRVIRNTIQNAQILAQSEGVLLSEVHLLKAFQVMATPSTMAHLIESDDKSYPKQASTTISTCAPSVVTNSTFSNVRVDEEIGMEE